jgi:hypothetical protein
MSLGLRLVPKDSTSDDVDHVYRLCLMQDVIYLFLIFVQRLSRRLGVMLSNCSKNSLWHR